jgi:NarL family two-component system response regulator YdfI
MRLGIVASAIALRAGLRLILDVPTAAGVSRELPEVVFEASSLNEFASLAPPVDVLVISAEAISGADLGQALPEEPGRLAVLLISDQPGAARQLLGLPLHAWGILPVESTAEEIQAAVQAVSEGLIVAAPPLLEPLLAQLPVGAASANGTDAEPELASLTERENQVLQLLARGLPNKQIAMQLGISEHTVKFHISSIYSKLQATNRTEAVRSGVLHGLISL